MTYQAILAGIRDGNYHQGGIRCLRLLRVDEAFFASLASDVVRLCEREASSDVGNPHHITNWTRPRGEVVQYSLLNASGRCDDFSDDHVPSCFGKRFHLASDYPTLGRVIDTVPHLVNARVNVLGPRARLAAHEEHSIIRTKVGSIGACARLHLPIETNPGAEIVVDGEVFHLDPGAIHLVNHGCVHAARNGAARRIHLVFDVLLTTESYRVIFDEGTSWSTPVDAGERVTTPRRTERIGAHVRLPGSVAREESDHVSFCQPQ